MQSHEPRFAAKATCKSPTGQQNMTPCTAVYSRVTAANQEEKEASFEEQRQACMKRAEEDGVPGDPDYAYQEQGTGAGLDRPLLGQLRRAVRAGEVGVIYACSRERLSRDLGHLSALCEEFKAAGADLRIVRDVSGDTHDGREMEYGHMEVCEEERQESLEQGMAGQGETTGSCPVSTGTGSAIYGYRYHNHRKMRTANEEADVVELVLEWAADGWTDRRIARQLNEMNIRTKRGKRWNRPMVRRILGDWG